MAITRIMAWGAVLLLLAGGARGQDPAAAAPSAELAPNVVFEVTSLRRLTDKGVMELKFAVTNSNEAGITLESLGLAFAGYLREISIIDSGSRKQYGIGYAGACLCGSFVENDGGVAAAGQRREFWAWYAMPAGSGVKKVAVQVPHVQPIMNVPLQ